MCITHNENDANMSKVCGTFAVILLRCYTHSQGQEFFETPLRVLTLVETTFCIIPNSS